MPTSVSAPPSAPEAAPIAAPASGINKDQPDQRTPKGSGQSPGRRRMKQLVQFDAAVRLLDGDDGVCKLYQVLVLHCEQLMANLLGLCLGRECDNDEAGHCKILQSNRRCYTSAARRFATA